MIEVEKKCIPTESFVKYLDTEARFLDEVILEDELFDFRNLSLIKNDVWLRRRNKRWELKIPVKNDKACDVYEELEDENLISTHIGVKNLTDDALFKISCLITHRKEYELEKFKIVIDEVTAPNTDFFYRLMEVEILVESQEKYQEAEQKILDFMHKFNIKSEIVNSKFVEYSKQFEKEIYEMLKKARRVKITA